MEPQKSQLFPQSLTFDDILLLPGFANFDRSEINLETNLTKKIKLKIPLISSPMDTVTESELAIELARLGGVGIIHRNLSIENQAKEVKKVLKHGFMCGAAVGAGKGFEERLGALFHAGVSLVVLDSAHGWSTQILEVLRFTKKKYPKIQVMVGNVATYDGAKFLINEGADSLRVGMGPGAICTTRVVSGMGVPQVTAILETARAAKKFGIPVIADGGIKYSGDMVKALALGASGVMMGSFFASCEEAPGVVHELLPSEVPARFKSISTCGGKCDTVEIHAKKHLYKFKEYRGMGSIGAMKKGAEVKSEGEFHGKSYKDRVLIAEGVEGLVPVKGTLQDVVDQAIGGIKSGMYYVGAKNLKALVKISKFTQITQASLVESHPHDLLITNPGKNYN